MRKVTTTIRQALFAYAASVRVLHPAAQLETRVQVFCRTSLLAHSYKFIHCILVVIGCPYKASHYAWVEEFSYTLCARPLPVRYATYKMADGRVGSGLRDYVMCQTPSVRYATYKMADGRVGSGLRDYCPSPWAAALVDTAEVTGKRLKSARRHRRTILEWSQSRIAFHRLQSVWHGFAYFVPCCGAGSLSTYPASCEQTSVWTDALKYIP